MEEDQVKERMQKWLRKQEFTVRKEPTVFGDSREVVLDYYAYGEQNGHPVIYWIECKGDNSLSQLLEGWIRTEFAIFYGGGLGILAVPNRAANKLLRHSSFLKQAESLIAIYDVETNVFHRA